MGMAGLIGVMRLIFSGLFWIFTCCALAAGEASRLSSLPAEEFRAAGLHKLTADELAKLEALIGNLGRTATPSATSSAAEKEKNPSWFRALVTLQEASNSSEAAEALESQIDGEYRGWSGKTLFRLQNGQVWQQNDSTTRVDSTRLSPKVRIYPGMLGAYWMEIEGVKQRVKVKPVKLQ